MPAAAPSLPHAGAESPRAAGTLAWQRAGDGWRAVLDGDWRGRGALALDDARPPATAGDGAAAGAAGPVPPIVLDGRALAGWDTGFAVALWSVRERWRGAGHAVHAESLPAGLAHLLELASAPAEPAEPPPRARLRTTSALAFVGEVLIAAAAAVAGRGRPRAGALLEQADACGPRSLAIVVVACALVGLMLAYMGGAQLGRIGAENYLADIVAVGMVRELGGLMAGIILAGRVGSAFAAQLATMKAGEEIDALRALGVDPVAHLVLPRVLALLAVGPVLIALGAAAGIAAGWPAATFAYGVPSAEYWHQAVRAIDATNLWIGLFKGELYVLLVALAGCRAGLDAGRGADAVGAATTRAVVTSLLWIVAAASLTTVVFTLLGY